MALEVFDEPVRKWLNLISFPKRVARSSVVAS